MKKKEENLTKKEEKQLEGINRLAQEIARKYYEIKQRRKDKTQQEE
jgi:hypothetical protein